MKALFFAFPVLFLFFSAFFLYISLFILIKKKPVIINSKWITLIVVISFLPIIISSIARIDLSSSNSLIHLFTPIMFIGIIVFYFFIIKGFSMYGVNEEIREALLTSLDKMSIKYQEKMNKIELPDLKNELNVSLQSWIGTGMIKIKHKKDLKIFKEIIANMKNYYAEKNVTPKIIVPIFYLFFGGIFVLMTVLFTILLIKVIIS
jgi:hypothetical protein